MTEPCHKKQVAGGLLRLFPFVWLGGIHLSPFLQGRDGKVEKTSFLES